VERPVDPTILKFGPNWQVANYKGTYKLLEILAKSAANLLPYIAK